MTTPIFDYNPEKYHGDAFSGAFLTKQSYIELLRIADHIFDLNMTKHSRELPCQQNSYLVISRRENEIWKGIGRKVSLNVTSMIYNEQYGVLLAMVQLKHNFTCNPNPHIVLAKRAGVNNILVSNVIKTSNIRHLYQPHKVHGKIGVIFGSGEEVISPEKKLINGLEVRATHNLVTRPEVVYAVEQPLPTKPSFVTLNEFQDMGGSNKGDEEVMEITLNKTKTDTYATGETYQGEPVMKGPRGGKYILKDGKKKYVPVGKESSGNDVVYNINILE